MARVPSQKGTSVLPVVDALKRHPDAKRLVPEQLWHYFDEHIVIGGWYPERDYWVLIDALVKTIDPKLVGGDVWRYFATTSAQADIGGVELKVSKRKGGVTIASKGVYRNFACLDPTDPEALFRRSVRLWSQYHDSGVMEIRGARLGTNTVVMRLNSFHIPLEGFVRLQGYYVEEFAQLAGVRLQSKVTRSTARGDPFCEWEFALEASPSSEAYLGSLPALSD